MANHTNQVVLITGGARYSTTASTSIAAGGGYFRRSALGSAPAIMVEPTEYGDGLDAAVRRWRAKDGRLLDERLARASTQGRDVADSPK